MITKNKLGLLTILATILMIGVPNIVYGAATPVDVLLEIESGTTTTNFDWGTSQNCLGNCELQGLDGANAAIPQPLESSGVTVVANGFNLDIDATGATSTGVFTMVINGNDSGDNSLFNTNLIVTITPATAGTSAFVGTLTVEGICGIDIAGALNFGTLSDGDTSVEQTITTTNTGTVGAEITTLGTDWIDSSSVTQMNAAQTAVSTSSGTFGSKTPLDPSTPVTLDASLGGTPLDAFYQTEVSLIDSFFSGSMTNTVTVSFQC